MVARLPLLIKMRLVTFTVLTTSCLCDFDRIMVMHVCNFVSEKLSSNLGNNSPLDRSWSHQSHQSKPAFFQVQFHPPNFVGSLGRWWQRRSGRLRATETGATTSATADLDLDLMLSPPPGSGLSRYKGPENFEFCCNLFGAEFSRNQALETPDEPSSTIPWNLGTRNRL